MELNIESRNLTAASVPQYRPTSPSYIPTKRSSFYDAISETSTYIARGAEQSTIEEMRKEQTVEGETKEYATKDETTVETVEVKRNHLSVPATHHSRTTPTIERACKDTL